MEAAIIIWLIAAKCSTVRILKQHIDKSFQKEINRICFILIVYTVFFSAKFIYHLALLIEQGPYTAFAFSQANLVGHTGCNFTIIFIAFYLHWKHVISIPGLFKMAWHSKTACSETRSTIFSSIQSASREETSVLLHAETESVISREKSKVNPP